MDWDLPDNVRMFQDVARKFATDDVAPNARQWDADANFPDELITKLGQIGLLGVYIPTIWRRRRRLAGHVRHHGREDRKSVV